MNLKQSGLRPRLTFFIKSAICTIMRALIVVDYQNDFITGALGYEKAKVLEGPIIDKIEEYRSNGDIVVFTKDCHDPERYMETQEGKRLPVPHCIDEEGRAIFGKVRQYADDSNTFCKPAFGCKELTEFFEDKDIDQFELCGTFITPCLMSNAVTLKTFFPEARIVVDATCTMAFNEEIGEKALDVMENMQMDIINRDKKAKDQMEFYS